MPRIINNCKCLINKQYLRLNVIKIFICMSEFETKNLQLRSLASLQIKVHYCRVDFFSSMISFQQEMLLSERHKNICNKLTETGIFG